MKKLLLIAFVALISLNYVGTNASAQATDFDSYAEGVIIVIAVGLMIVTAIIVIAIDSRVGGWKRPIRARKWQRKLEELKASLSLDKIPINLTL